MPEKHQIKCPICGKPVEFFAEPLGPFCSDRCKMIDLGAWASESYRVLVVENKDEPETGEPREEL